MTKLTAEHAAMLIARAEEEGREPRFFEPGAEDYRPLTPKELADGKRYIKRMPKHLQFAEEQAAAAQRAAEAKAREARLNEALWKIEQESLAARKIVSATVKVKVKS